MCSQLSAKLASSVDPQNKPGPGQPHDERPAWRWLRMWKQVFLAELLNLLERNFYDLKR